MTRIKAQIEATAGELEVLFRYMPLHLGDWLTGTAGMTLEHEGAYMRFLAHLYNRGKPFPDDDTFMARVMNLSSRVWKRIKAALIETGKIVCRNGALTNSRFETERRKRADEMRKKAAAAEVRWGKKEQSLPEVSPKFAESLPEVLTKLAETEPKKVNEINETAKIVHMESVIRNPISEIRTNNIAPGKPLAERLEEAAGRALANPAACPGLLVLSEPNRWLSQGCDLELDILPTIAAVAARQPAGRIKGWSFFTQAIADAKAARERPMPSEGARPVNGMSTNPMGMSRADQKRLAAKENHDYVRNKIAELERSLAEAQ